MIENEPLRVGPGDARSDVLIIGGGLAGVACALALRDSGLSVAIAEAAAHLGGRARSWRDQQTGDWVDVGPHVITSHHRNYLDLLDQLGTRGEVVWQKRPLITLFDGRRTIDAHLAPLPAPLSLLPTFAAANHLSLRSRLSNWKPTRKALDFLERDIGELDGVDGATFLHALGVEHSFIDWFWRSMCMTILSVPLERSSAAALMRCYAQLCGHRRYYFGFPSSGLDSLFVPGATRALQSGGVRIALKTTVTRVESLGCRNAVAHLADGTRWLARFAVCAVPPQEASALLAPHATVPSFEPSRYLSVYLWFDRRITTARFWTRVWSPRTVNFDFYDLANIRGLPADQGSLIASNVIHSQRLPALSDTEIVDVTLRELAEFAPLARGLSPLHTRVHRVPMAVPCPAPGTEARRPANALRGLPAVVLAGDWTNTGLPACMESAVRSGRLAAEEILRRCGQDRAIALPPPATTGLAGLLRRRREQDIARQARA